MMTIDVVVTGASAVGELMYNGETKPMFRVDCNNHMSMYLPKPLLPGTRLRLHLEVLDGDDASVSK